MKRIFIFSLFFWFQVHLEAHIASLTVAKSGTNLVRQMIEGITGKKKIYCMTRGRAAALSGDLFCETHFQHKRVVDFILANPDVEKVVINIRDPRDVLVSAAFFYPRLPIFDETVPNGGRLVGRPFYGLSIRQRVKLLLSCSENRTATTVYDIKSVCKLLASDLYSDQRFFLTRYENLVGVNGTRCCVDLASFLGYSQSKENVRKMLRSCIGSSPTFRAGRVGSWKAYFDDELKALFKAVLGEELIFLGYESDDRW